MTKFFRSILLSYIVAAITGAFVLSLDVMRTKPLEFIDLLFTTTSAVCVTGLTTLNLATDFTFYGQCVVLALIQLGGFGFMMIASMILIFVGKNIDFQSKFLIKEQLDYPHMQGLIKFSKKAFFFVVGIEFVGAVLLALIFWFDMPFKEALWAGIFHSVSAFNNAGFSTFETNLMGYRDNFFINLIISSLIILGGLGFLVLSEIYGYRKDKNHKFSIHTKLVLLFTPIFIVLGFVIVLLFEWYHKGGLGDLSAYSKIISSYFLSVNLRTSGFNSIDLSFLNDETLFFSSILMVIGAAPGGTAGGIKITTVAVLLIYAYQTLRGRECIVFKRVIPDETIKKAFLILIMAMFYVVISAMILSAFEDTQNKMFLPLLFEICSAFGTVGLSVGDGGVLSLSAKFGEFGKIYIMTLMFLGRVGVLMFSAAIIKSYKKTSVSYPKEEVIL
ncbi:TrkH family potassium uptake protein [Campylobacter geochelonis]|uniref:Cation transport protein n=1 Tax=Campylobacter geochelonis TaxID=1780362 RepID=A0A128EF11_9BACT|nr:TrkH family potassium uptake protein [Campylobacter geochelonis]QKF71784.1 potassium transporter KtrAB, KtrB subunit [Campylobacter geochelonis]CZE47516.1 cation transport protein [Campylobacter geochelonis]CZE48449.1 cation transport protein [Campylobacter geochelonis]